MTNRQFFTRLLRTLLLVLLAFAVMRGPSLRFSAATTVTPQRTAATRPLADNPAAPAAPVKLIFIHHSTGENWLADGDGGLGSALRDNNYFVSDTNYGWGPGSIGDATDIGHWWNWFQGPSSSTYLAALYAESGQHSSYSRLAADPGGENAIVLFKSCFPNSQLGGSPSDPPATGSNPLRGQDAGSADHTVANAKGIYADLLAYFATRQDKLFVVITAPPLATGGTNASHAANARAFNDWLVHDWLDGYPYSNVAVFDFYNVLTSNGGNANTNDLGLTGGNHHRWWSSAVQHVQPVANNFSAYPTGDSHPSRAGNLKATGEFVQLLNVFYHRWQDSGSAGPTQPTGLTAVHRSGQTFLTWNEVAGLSGERYHVYRHTVPIDATTIAGATRLTQTWGALPEGSSAYQTERDRGPGGSSYVNLRNYVISDLGPQLADTTGLLVWTGHATGNFYYAVTTTSGGVENRSDFSAANTLASPRAETAADPAPVLVWQAPGGRGRVYTQFMDLSQWNPTFDATGAYGYAYAYNYYVGLPDPANCPGGATPATLPLYLYLQGWGARYEAGDAAPYWCTVVINGDDPHQTWYYGFSAAYDYRPGGVADSGPIVNFTEERLLRSIYDTLRSPDYSLDPQRVYVYGHSMGGSGALALGMRYPDVFAASYSSEPMTNYATAGAGGGTAWRDDLELQWGSVATDLPIENRGRYAGHLAVYDGLGVWDWQNHQAQLVARRGDEMAHISLAHGTLDDVIEWATQGRPAYEPFYLSRRAFSGATVAAGHTWLGFAGMAPNVADVSYAGPFYNFKALRDETLPGLSYASGSSAVPPAGAGATYNIHIEWSASWHAWDGAPVDTAGQWRISLRTTNGSSQTVDVTPRRVQHFDVTAGAGYDWENRRVSDNGLVASGSVVADDDGLIIVPAFAVSPGGNRLILEPAAGPVNTPTPTPTATSTSTSALTSTPTSTPTATPTTGAAGDTYTFQDGVGPDPGYNGTTDVILANDASANANLGWVDQLETYYGDSENRRALVRWNLATLPAAARIASARVELYRYGGEADAPMTVALYRLTRGWVEGTGWDYWPDPGYAPDGATWSLAAPGAAWTTAGGDYDHTSDYGHGANGILDQVTLTAGQGNGWISLDATAAVRAWIEDGQPNHGLLLRGLNGRYTYHYFHSHEQDTASLRPRLVVELGSCRADANADGIIDLADTQLVAAGWPAHAGQPAYDPDLDMDRDGAINVIDVQLVAARSGMTCAEAPPLPDPAATATPTVTPSPTATPTPTGTRTPDGNRRPWPNTGRGVHVFNDQLSNGMSDAQVAFAATHYDGTQKMTRDQADRLRAVVPDFLILHYRLGHGLGYRSINPPCQPSGDWLSIIEGDDWVQEWPGDANVVESWFYHWPEASSTRVLNCDWGWYLMNLDNAGWRAYWRDEVLRQVQANDADGVFMDSLSVPNYLMADHYSPHLPDVDSEFEDAWAARITDWLSWLQGQSLGDYYLVPNVGEWITSRETTDYSPADGLMVEGFAIAVDASPFDLADWRLQMNRILGAVGGNQALLLQTTASGAQERMFTLGSYLLVKGSRTYLNIELDLAPEWWPEYDIAIGAATEAAGDDIADLYDAANQVYRRDFDNGFVLVNPTSPWDGTGHTATINLGGTYYLAQTSGGGEVPEDGTPPGAVSYSPVTGVTLPPYSAAVLLNAAPAELNLLPYVTVGSAAQQKGTRTSAVKRGLAGLLAFVGIRLGGIPAATGTSAATAAVGFAQDRYAVPVGDSLALALRGEGVERLGGWQAELGFAPAVVEFTQVVQGDLLASSGRAVGSLGPEVIGAGQVALGAYSSGSPAAVGGAGTLAQPHFRGLALGSTALTVREVILASVSGADVSSQPATARDTEIVVVAALPVSILETGGDPRLNWTSPTTPPYFEIWSSPNPYFGPGEPDAEVVAEDGSITCTIAGATVTCELAGGAGGPGNSRFYIVRVLDAAGAPIGQSFRLGEFDFGLVPGA